MLYRTIVLFVFFLHCSNAAEEVIYSEQNNQSFARIRNVFPIEESQENIARKFITNYNSNSPVVLVVDDDEEVNEEARSFYRDLNEIFSNQPRINVLLMKYNSTGASPVLETMFNDPTRFEELLHTNPQPTQMLSFSTKVNRTASFFAILNAVQTLPANSGIVLFTNRAVNDESLAAYALAELRKKRTRVYVVWSGVKSDGVLLRDLVRYTSGLFFNSPLTHERKYQNFVQKLAGEERISTILTRKNLGSTPFTVNFPVDSGVASIHFIFTTSITKGLLTTPTGVKLDLLSGNDLARFSSGSFVRISPDKYEVHLDFGTSSSHEGIWTLNTANSDKNYSLAAYAVSSLNANALVQYRGGIAPSKRNVSIEMIGDVAQITDVALLREDGAEISKNVPFMRAGKNRTLHVELDTDDTYYFKISGKNFKGENFERLTYVRQANNIFPKSEITIDVGLGSNLVPQPRRLVEVFFDVTNNLNKVTYVYFSCSDVRSLMLRMSPLSAWINPQETVRVTLTLNSSPYAVSDLITFKANNMEKTLSVDYGQSSNLLMDRSEPEIDYRFTSDCTGKLSGDCADTTWTVEVKARDTESGLLQVVSNPRGLFFPNSFTTGTKEEITGFYSETCCNPEVELTAYDRQNNRRSRHTTWSAGAISALVLGIVLLIIIIIVIVVIIWKCCCKDKISYDLPIYRGAKKF